MIKLGPASITSELVSHWVCSWTIPGVNIHDYQNRSRHTVSARRHPGRLLQNNSPSSHTETKITRVSMEFLCREQGRDYNKITESITVVVASKGATPLRTRVIRYLQYGLSLGIRFQIRKAYWPSRQYPRAVTCWPPWCLCDVDILRSLSS